ncbi:MAG: aminotransferase class V-fold PLP-dependent enzyme [Bacillota bacterium]|nr:aminotransferase class V-fold PLP-dependent enzyme [Bacillota bacterium]
MIYLDNTSTTSPKPEEVCIAVETQIRKNCGSPGRSAAIAGKNTDIIFETRMLIAKLLNATPDRIIFTCSATDSLNLAIKGYLKKGDHVIVTSMDHNSILRPVMHMEREGIIEVSVIASDSKGYINSVDFFTQIRPNTKLIIATHASNVVGTLADIEKIGEIALANRLAFLVDASQSIGVVPLDVQKMHIDMLALPGHKSLFGPTGTGALYIRDGIDLVPLRHGGTGTFSESMFQPEEMPHRYESGTGNLIGIAGLNAGIKYILSEGMEKIREHEENLADYMYQELLKLNKVIVYGTEKACDKTAVISLNINNWAASKIGQLLSDKFGIITRAGLHCAPLAHKAIGTESCGTVRFGIGYFNTKEDIDCALEALNEICKKQQTTTAPI